MMSDSLRLLLTSTMKQLLPTDALRNHTLGQMKTCLAAEDATAVEQPRDFQLHVNVQPLSMDVQLDLRSHIQLRQRRDLWRQFQANEGPFQDPNLDAFDYMFRTASSAKSYSMYSIPSYNVAVSIPW